MTLGSAARRRFAAIVFFGAAILSGLHAQSAGGRAQIALFAPMGQQDDAALSAVLSAVADSIELSLAVLQRYDVHRLPSVDPVQGLQTVRAYCTSNRMDQAILGSGAARTSGGYDFRLIVYDRLKDSVTFDRTGSSSGALDMFDATDALVASMLDGLSGTHILFGSLAVTTDPPGAAVTVNGRDVGAAPVSLRGVPVGTVTVSARAEGREETSVSAVVADEATTTAQIRLPRSMGTLSVQAPYDAVVRVRSAEAGEKSLAGSGEMTLPTGEYELQAESTGLPAASGLVTITRNQTAPWVPWPKAFLVLRSSLPGSDGSRVFVDGQDRGAVPGIVDVEAGALHEVRVKRAKYYDFLGYFNLSAGSKETLRPELDPFPGSIKVDSSMPGAGVALDGVDREGRTPLVLTDVAAGPHVLRVHNLEQGGKIYTVPDPINVTVNPDEQASVSATFVEGKTVLRISNTPPGSVLAVDGQNTGETAFTTTGMEVSSGQRTLAIEAPDTEGWTFTTRLVPGPVALFTDAMVYRVPHRTMKLDGNVERWQGLIPAVTGSAYSGFSGQPGTAISRGYVCRDDGNLYVRYEFSDGTPTVNLAKGFAGLQYIVLIETDKGQIQAKTNFVGGTIYTHMGVWNEARKSWFDMGENAFGFHVGKDSLDVSIPLIAIRQFLKSRYLSLALVAEKVGPPPDQRWLEGTQTSVRAIATDF